MKLLKELTENITIISVMLVFIGYYNFYSYYSLFNIDIHNYLTTSELLLSFLPISIYIIITFLIFFIYIAFFIDNLKSNGNVDSVSFSKMKSYFKIKPFNWLNFISDLIHYLIHLSGLLFFLLITLSIIIGLIKKEPYLYDTKIGLIIILVIWFSFVHGFLEKIVVKTKLVRDMKVFQASSLIVSLIAIITLINTTKAYKIKGGFPIYSVEFKTKNRIIKTDERNIYIGITKEYLFIRNIVSAKTTVYNRKDIEELAISKVIPKKNIEKETE